MAKLKSGHMLQIEAINLAGNTVPRRSAASRLRNKTRPPAPRQNRLRMFGCRKAGGLRWLEMSRQYCSGKIFRLPAHATLSGNQPEHVQEQETDDP